MLLCDLGERVAGLRRRECEEKRKLRFALEANLSFQALCGAGFAPTGILPMALQILHSPDLARSRSSGREQMGAGLGESLQGWSGELVDGEGMDRGLHEERASQYLIPYSYSSGKCFIATQELSLGAGYLIREQNPQTPTITVGYKKCHRGVW